MTKKTAWLSGLAILLGAQGVWAADGSREAQKMGVMVGVLGTPMPSMYGFMLGYNVTGWLRAKRVWDLSRSTTRFRPVPAA